MTDWTPQALLTLVEASLGRPIEKPEVFSIALTHSSYANEQGLGFQAHYERLEFLGDAVLELIVSEFLLENFQDKREGDLSKCRSAVVNERTLSRVAKGLDLGEHMRFGKGEAREKGHKKNSILADAFEALCAAIYLSNGLQDAKVFVLHHLRDDLLASGEMPGLDDSKSLLQEFTQKYFKDVPRYQIVDEEGPDHRKTFVTEVWLQGKKWGTASGKSKKESQQNAARITLEKLKRRHEKE